MNSKPISGGVPAQQFLFIHALKGWHVALTHVQPVHVAVLIEKNGLWLTYFGLALVLEALLD